MLSQHSHQAHRRTFKRVNACYHWLPTKHTHLFLDHSIGHHSTWDKAQCFMLETLHQSPQYETSPTRNSVPKVISWMSSLQITSSIGPLLNCCQLPIHLPQQSLQLSNPSLSHLVHKYQGVTLTEMPGFSSTAFELVLADLRLTWK